MKIVTFEEFKQRSIDKNGDIFDFDESVYSTMSSVIEYKCKEYNHLQRRTPQQTLNLHCGCTECKIKIKNTEQFIAAAKLIHGDKFNFDLCEYFNTNTKVHLICNDCGEHIFPQAHSILKGFGCYNCAPNKPIDKEKFLQLCLDVNGENFEYSRVNYTKYESPVEIFCITHGIWFFQKPKHHILHGGCRQCTLDKIGNKNRKDVNVFIQESQDKHGIDAFDYSEVNYINVNTKIKIFCNTHKDWILQTPTCHLNGGCDVCGKLEGAAGRKYTLEEFIQRATTTHNDKYFYNNVEYINGDLPVSIICKRHNFMFMQTPYRHINGSNCPLCAQEQRKITASKTLEQFIQDAQSIHGTSAFDYSEVKYVNTHTKVKIFCNECKSWFEQTPCLHLTQKRKGCVNCKNNMMSHGERKILKFLKENNIKFLPQKTLDGCSYIAALKFDFILYDVFNNVIAGVEFQGAQHYRAVCFGGISKERAEENLKIVQTRDFIKKEYCEKNGIPLLCIHYSDTDKIPTIIKSFMRSLDDYLEPL